ncbi:Inner membrane protein YrbG [Novipirellula aureliae]|uniref:Inner membrane protein YrbG n=1 Tax=Novipirellula aureliae TaxID=2527966 RepID=A0A5C6DVH2_9BACT|nr:calcium/sodium antiporter [Novipirellula aureliae]TWU39947.1 Inner membrane protein YrbG [Novipirellula aureliae]
MIISLLWIVGGLALLVIGGEALVRGASSLARIAHISPLVIGLTVVAFGTSAPELATSVGAAFSGKGDMAIGNVIGSNIANVLLILGIASLIKPLKVQSQLVRLDVPLMVFVSVGLLIFAWNGTISRIEGCGLFAAIVIYTIWLLLRSRRESATVQQEFDEAIPTQPIGKYSVLIQCILVVAALAMLILGANMLVGGASDLARVLEISELVIGLTIVAVGTSLPELITSVMAAFRGESDIAVGNVVGSNLFNILSVLGAAAAVSPNGLQVPTSALRFDIPMMILVSIVCLPIFFTGYRISRWEGMFFLSSYIAFVAYQLI